MVGQENRGFKNKTQRRRVTHTATSNCNLLQCVTSWRMPPRRAGRPKASAGSGGTKTRNTKIEYIEDNEKRAATQTKRTTGLLKKAVELHVLSGAEVFVFVQQCDTLSKGKDSLNTRNRVYTSSDDNWMVALSRLRDNVTHSAASVQAVRTSDYVSVFTKPGRRKKKVTDLPFSYVAPDQSDLAREAERTRHHMLPPGTDIDLTLVDTSEVPKVPHSSSYRGELQVVPPLPVRAPGDTRRRNPKKDRLRRGIPSLDTAAYMNYKLESVIKKSVISARQHGMYKCAQHTTLETRMRRYIRHQALRSRGSDYDIARRVAKDTLRPLCFRQATSWLETHFL